MGSASSNSCCGSAGMNQKDYVEMNEVNADVIDNPIVISSSNNDAADSKSANKDGSGKPTGKSSKKQPIATNYKPGLIGGKANNLINLNNIISLYPFINIPSFMVLPVSDYAYAINKLGITQKLTNLTCIDHEKINAIDFNELQQLLMKATESEDSRKDIIPSQTREALSKFIDPSKRYAVRSSASVEDGNDSSFAGAFKTYLNVRSVDEVEKAIIMVWASMLDPLVKPLFQKSTLSSFPQMAVVVMEQLDPDVAGVLFTSNVITKSKNSMVINAAYGQGEGVCGGLVPCDEFWVERESRKIVKKVIEKKTHRMAVVNDNNEGGVTKQEVSDVKQQESACITDIQLTQLHDIGLAIEKNKNSPQDIEFAIVNDKIYILQTRPITTRLENLEFKAPKPGLFRFNGHATKPYSKLYQEIWTSSMSRGSPATCATVGLNIIRCDTTIVNGWPYFCLRPDGAPEAAPKSLPPPWLMAIIMKLTAGKYMKKAKSVFENKEYLTFLEEFHTKLIPEHITSHYKMMDIDMKSMTNEQLAEHVGKLVAYAEEGYYNHSLYSEYNLVPVGWYVLRTLELCNKPEHPLTDSEVFASLDTYSPVTLGLHGEFPKEFEIICNSKIARELILASEKESVDNKSAQEIINKLKNVENLGEDPSVGKAIRKIFRDTEYRLVDGYDPIYPTLGEEPKLLLGNMLTCLRKMDEQMKPGAPSVHAHADAIAEKIQKLVPKENLDEWQDLLKDARATSCIRDERAIYTDLWACGILRRCLVEVAERVKSAKATPEGEEFLVLDASREEIQNWLTKGTPLPINELVSRRSYRETASPLDVPQFLGGENLEPPMSAMGDKYLGRVFGATMYALKHIFEGINRQAAENAIANEHGNDPNTIVGISGSLGEYIGTARLLKKAEDASKVQKGDVVISQYSSSIINCILPVAGAIVCDLGGTLSHAAICARELKLPCVTGCHVATSMIKDGDKVLVDGTRGLIKILEKAN